MSVIIDEAGQPLEGLQAGTSPEDLIKETDAAGFAQDVVEASMSVPVIVDFWATWCEPCKTLGPMLEKQVLLAGGQVKMVKVDIDKEKALAAQLQIKSVPTVYAFKDGQPVDAFTGAVPESQIKQFIAKLTKGAGKSPIEQALDQAEEFLTNGDAESASGIFTQVLNADQENVHAFAGLIKCCIAADDKDSARKMVDQIPDKLRTKPEITSAVAALEMAEQSADIGEIEPLQAKLAEDENDHQTRFDLALALFNGGKQEEALEALLEIVRRDNEWNDQGARKQLLKFFEIIGLGDPLTNAVRRKLSTLMFS
ncbi:MAG: thioredoxin [Rhodospirillales bacterium]|nr:thioredoxin [Rhodospirillales bacterium]